jgi:hypothetical protein
VKKLRTSKTFLVNLAAIVAAAVTGILGANLLTPEMAAYAVAGLGVLNIFLRVISGKAISGI